MLLAATIDAASEATTVLEVAFQHAPLCVRRLHCIMSGLIPNSYSTQLFQVHPILCGELFRVHNQSEYRGHAHRQTTSISLDIECPTITHFIRKCVLHRQV